MPTDPLDQLRLPSQPLEPRRGFVAHLQRRVVNELAPLLPAHYLQEVTAMTVEVDVAAPTVTASLSCENAREMIQWLVDMLEFRVAALHDEPGGGVAHAVLSWRTGNLFLSSRHPGIWGTTGPATICLAVDDPAEVDRLYEKARAANAEIIEELSDSDYGSHEFGIRDPIEGNLWAIGTYRPPLATG